MASAAYDGHERSMGDGVGAKNADKGFKVILAAVTGTGRRNLDYMRMIALWAKAFRKDQRFPADVLNFHGYGSSDNEQASNDKTPEETDMLGQLKKLVAWRDENTPDLEVWDTEFGWDTDQRSGKLESYTSGGSTNAIPRGTPVGAIQVARALLVYQIQTHAARLLTFSILIFAFATWSIVYCCTWSVYCCMWSLCVS